MTVSHADAEKSVGDSRMSGAWKLGERGRGDTERQRRVEPVATA